MKQHTIVHIADEMKEGVQKCFYCEAVLADYAHAMIPEGSPQPTGFPQGALVGKVANGTFVINVELGPGEVRCQEMKEEESDEIDSQWAVKVKIDDWHPVIVAFASSKELARQEAIQVFRRGFVQMTDGPEGCCFVPIHRVQAIDVVKEKDSESNGEQNQ